MHYSEVTHNPILKTLNVEGIKEAVVYQYYERGAGEDLELDEECAMIVIRKDGMSIKLSIPKYLVDDEEYIRKVIGMEATGRKWK